MKLRQARKILDISFERCRPETIIRAARRLAKLYAPAFGPPTMTAAVASLRAQQRIEQQIFEAMDAGSCFSAMTCTTNDFCTTSGPTLDEAMASMRTLMNREVPVMMRVSPAAMEKLKCELPPAPLMPPSPFDFGFRPLRGLTVELDFSLFCFQVEVDYNTGRTEKLYPERQGDDGQAE